MPVDSYPSAGRDTGDGDGVISDVEYEALVSPFYPSGIVGTPEDDYPVFCDGTGTRGVHFRAGAVGMVRGGRISHGATVTTISAAANVGSNPRYDLAVWRLDRSGDATTIRPALLTGSSSPAGPTPTQDPTSDTSGIWEHPLMIVPVLPGDTTIPAGRITPAMKVGYWLAPPRYITKSGQGRPGSAKGQEVFEWDTNKRLVGDGSKFLTVGEDSGPVGLVTKTGWTIASGTSTKFNGLVLLSGVRIDRAGGPLGAQAPDQIIGAVPAGHEPLGGPKIVGYTGNGQVLVYVLGNGQLQLVANDGALATGAQMYLNDITYRAKA
jgi:hypothetical protein